jgi:hypothetical protein
MRFLTLAALLLTVACDTVESKDAGYEDGCLDGSDFGYANGLMHGEACSDYDDDPGERYSEDGDAYEVSYNEGYTDCYPDGYSDGYYEGTSASEC